MSSMLVRLGKKGKRVLKKILPEQKHSLSYTRRIERIKTDERIVAMTFDDGPMNLPASPDRSDGRTLTDILLDSLEEYGAKGTFDIVGDTSGNYPDEDGTTGQPDWGGVHYDHYPDFGKDDLGGAVHNDRLIRRMLDGGHQITNHTYQHRLFGRKPFVYGKRHNLSSFDEAVEDVRRLHDFMKENYGYEMTMGRPPHYVDHINGGFTSYDVYDALDYQYMAASFDGQGWLPVERGTEDESLEAEVDDMVRPLEKALAEDPDALCGQIIFQKDGYNMARRTPVAYGLRKQLEILKKYGYKVVTVNDLLTLSPFADTGRDDPDFELMCRLLETHAVAYSDNTLRLDQPMTMGGLAMLLAPKADAIGRRVSKIRSGGKRVSGCWGAINWCQQQHIMGSPVKVDAPVVTLPEEYFDQPADFSRRSVYRAYKGK